MNVEEALIILDAILAPQRLSKVQELVFRQCFLGRTYHEIAESLGYDYDYIRVTGYRLWQAISESLGERVTKYNFRSVLRQQEIRVLQQKTLVSTTSTVRSTPQTVYPSEETPAIPAPEFPSGAVPLESPFYMARSPIEQRVCEEINKPGALIRIRAPKQWGKTSLLLRMLAYAEVQGYQTVHLNLQQVDPIALENLDRFLRWFCANIAQHLQLAPHLEDYWDEDLGSKVSCTTYLRNYILQQIETPLIIALDEAHYLFEHLEIAQNFLPLLRFWHEEANNREVWQKLRLVVVHSTEVYIPLNLNQSPFNVGLPIRLQGFTTEQAQILAARHGFSWTTEEEGAKKLNTLQDLVDGHPFLLRLAFYHLFHADVSIEQLLTEAPTPVGIYRDHLMRHLATLQTHPELATAFTTVIMAEEPVEIETLLAYKLESMGLVTILGNRVTPRCNLYRLYFRERLKAYG
jgi:AAA-like domain